jgi:hypothetical protein
MRRLKRRGGRRSGAGRKGRYPGGTLWTRVPLPLDFARGLAATDAAVREEVVRIVRAARPGLGWE